MESNKVVYLHHKATDGSVFYVGMGSPRRANSKRRGCWWLGMVSKYGYWVEIYAEGLSKAQAWEIEIGLIKKYGRRDNRTGILINQTDGGAASGLSFKTNKKRSERLSAIVRTPEWNKKISIALKNVPRTKEWAMKIGNKNRGRVHTEQAKQKMRDNNKSKIVTARPLECHDAATGEFIANYISAREASEALMCSQTCISNVIHGKNKKTKSKRLKKYVIIKRL